MIQKPISYINVLLLALFLCSNQTTLAEDLPELNGDQILEKMIEATKSVSTATYRLDKIDRQLLYEMSIGTKMKELPTIIPMSMAGIEKRKKHLKVIFEVDENDDRELILKAKEKGFI